MKSFAATMTGTMQAYRCFANELIHLENVRAGVPELIQDFSHYGVPGCCQLRHGLQGVHAHRVVELAAAATLRSHELWPPIKAAQTIVQQSDIGIMADAWNV